MREHNPKNPFASLSFDWSSARTSSALFLESYCSSCERRERRLEQYIDGDGGCKKHDSTSEPIGMRRSSSVHALVHPMCWLVDDHFLTKGHPPTDSAVAKAKIDFCLDLKKRPGAPNRHDVVGFFFSFPPALRCGAGTRQLLISHTRTVRNPCD